MAKMMFDAPAENAENTYDPVIAPESSAAKTEESEPKSALAVGLPAAWSIEPPALVVRRKTRVI